MLKRNLRTFSMGFLIIALVIPSFFAAVSSPTKAVQPSDNISTPISQSTTQVVVPTLFQDNFDDNQFDENLWEKIQVDGGTVDEKNGRLQVTIPSHDYELTAAGYWGNYSQAGYMTKSIFGAHTLYGDNQGFEATVNVVELDNVMEVSLMVSDQKITNLDPINASNWYRILKIKDTHYPDRHLVMVESRINGGPVSVKMEGPWFSSTGQLRIKVSGDEIAFYENGVLRYAEPYSLASDSCYVSIFTSSLGCFFGTDSFDDFAVYPSNADNSALNISPSAGPGGVDIMFTGSGYPVNSSVDISYYDPSFHTWNYLASVTANSSGKFVANSEVPDLKKSLGSGEYTETFNTHSYRAEINGTAYGYAYYNQYLRGLKTVGNQTANGLYGNGTNLVSSVRALVGDNISLSGKWFHPGIVYIRLDSASVVGTVTSSEWLNANIIGSTVANSNGSFNTSVVVPKNVEAGEHYIAVEDSQTRVIVKIFVSTASLELSPASGVGGANVQFTGSGYPASTDVTIYYLDPSFGTWKIWTTTTSDSSGGLYLNAEIPDLGRSVGSGDSGNISTTISLRSQINGVAYSYANYVQFWRGLSNVGNQVAQGLFGNGTNFVSSVIVKPGDSLAISGKCFHPGVVYVRFDGATVVGTVTSAEWRNAQVIGTTTASSTGSFSTTVTIPAAYLGDHYLSIEDSQTHLIIKVSVLGQAAPTPTPISSSTTNPTSTPIPTPNPNLPVPAIDVSCRGTSLTNGYKVSINGNLQLNGNPLVDKPVLISFSVTGGDSWESLTLVKTQSDGNFAALWAPDVTGNYLVKATIMATSIFNGASKTVALALTPDEEKNVFTLNSNSTITQFAFNSTSKELSFNASGPSGSTGYVSIYIPQTLVSDISNLKTYVDGNQVSFNSTSQGDAWLIAFHYLHSQHKITMELANIEQEIVTSPPPLQWINYAILAAIIAILIGVAAALVVAFKQTKKQPLNK
jgi:hypothetical protein